METDASGAAPSPTRAGQHLFAYLEGGICSAAGAHYPSPATSTLEESPLSQPVLSASSAGVVYDAGGEPVSFRTVRRPFPGRDGTLLSARVNDSGWLAVTAQQSGHKGSAVQRQHQPKEIIQLNFHACSWPTPSPDSKTVADHHRAGERPFRQLALYPVDSSEPSATSPWATWRCWTWTMRRSSWALGDRSVGRRRPGL